MILISILVHEKYEVILDQLANFRKFAPDALIIIHPSRQFVESAPEVPDKLAQVPGVLVNPAPFYTGTGMVLKCHVSNYLHALDMGVTFSHFCLHSSNDLFISSGVEDYVLKNDFGFFKTDLFSESFGFSHWKQNFLSDKAYRKIMRDAGSKPTHLVSQAEGTFYPREAFGEFVKFFKRHAWREVPAPIGYVHGTNLKLVNFFEKVQRSPKWGKYVRCYFYTREEFYPPNFFALRCAQPAAPYCFMNWKNGLNVSAEDIKEIRSGGGLLGRYERIFSVKRVNREINDPVRSIIRTLD